MKLLVYLPLALAVGLGLYAAGVEDPARQQALVAWVAVAIGLSAAFSGVRAVARGEVLVKSRHARRDEQPGTFWTTVIVFRFGIAALFLAFALWRLV